MDQSVESISSQDPAGWRQGDWLVGRKWRCLPQPAVRAVAVVMVGVLGQHRRSNPSVVDERNR